jgi:hypothetical protein
MSKGLSLLLFLFAIPLLAEAQTPFENELKNTEKIIRRNIYIDRDWHSSAGIGRYDYCFYDISLDSTGVLLDITLIAPDSSHYAGQFRKIAALIKQKWTKAPTPVRKIFIPVLLIYEGLDKQVLPKDERVMKSFNFMQRQLSANLRFPDVWVNNKVEILSYTVRKN